MRQRLNRRRRLDSLAVSVVLCLLTLAAMLVYPQQTRSLLGSLYGLAVGLFGWLDSHLRG